MERKKAAVFDLEGTLADTLEALAQAGFGPIDKERYKQFAGDGAAAPIKRCLCFVKDEKLRSFDQVFPAYMEIFARDCMYGVKP